MGAVLKLLTGVPVWAWALAGLAAWGGWHRWRAIDARQDFERARQAAAVEQAASAAAVAQETARRLKAVQEAADAAQLQAQADRAAADRARRARDSLLERIAAVQAGGGAADPAVAGQCEAARRSVDLLADVLRRADARAGELAAAADAARTAGQACERAYESLNDTTKGPRP